MPNLLPRLFNKPIARVGPGASNRRSVTPVVYKNIAGAMQGVPEEIVQRQLNHFTRPIRATLPESPRS